MSEIGSKNFTSIPVLNFSDSEDPTRRPAFISSLRDALINVGFLYLSGTDSIVSPAVIATLISYIPLFFDLPLEEKEAIGMVNSPHFLGYSRFGSELTKGAVDHREQIDIATEMECRWKEGDPEYLRLWGPSQVRVESLVSFLHTQFHFLS
jgi:isopenicillin N synthase-like dioxygenase